MKHLAFIMLAAALLMGCSKNESKSEQNVMDQKEFTSGVESSDPDYSSGDVKFVHDVKSVVFSYKDSIPIIADGTVYGKLKIKQCEKLGIWDWTNKKAVKNNIHSSYTINLQYNLNKSADVADSRNFKCEAFMVGSGGDIVGSPCCVGWSGFSDETILLQDSLQGRLEVGVQPEQKMTKKMKLLLRVSDSEGTSYNDIIIGNRIFKDAVNGPSILKKGTKKNITSVNGAKYFVDIDKVLCETQLDVNGNPDDFIVFRYSLGYLKKPTKKVKVAKFDEYNKNKMSSTLVVGVSSSGSNELLYSNYPKARWYLYSDSNNEEDTEMYVTTSGVYIDAGIKATYLDNRPVSKTMPTRPEYVRLSVEFPEEQAARTPDQMMKFNGRFVVYQVIPAERRLRARD